MSTKSKKKSPRSIPRSQADVDKALERGRKLGREEGINGALIIMLYTLLDKYGASDEDLKKFVDDFRYTQDGIVGGWVTVKDLQRVVREEYGTVLHLTE